MTATDSGLVHTEHWASLSLTEPTRGRQRGAPCQSCVVEVPRCCLAPGSHTAHCLRMLLAFSAEQHGSATHLHMPPQSPFAVTVGARRVLALEAVALGLHPHTTPPQPGAWQEKDPSILVLAPLVSQLPLGGIPSCVRGAGQSACLAFLGVQFSPVTVTR